MLTIIPPKNTSPSPFKRGKSVNFHIKSAMQRSNHFKEFLTISRKNRIGIIGLLLLLPIVFFLPKFIPGRAGNNPNINDTSWIAALKQLEQKEALANGSESGIDEENTRNYQFDRSSGSYNNQGKTGTLFYFDPNTLSFEGWEKLGIREKTIHTIQNYLSKGGRFREKEDLQKIYGLYKDQYERLAPYIVIENPEQSSSNLFPNEKEEQPEKKKEFRRYSIIEINTADTNAFISLPGIGSKLASRIVNFREKLGGFYSIDQISEIYGLPDSTFQKIKQFLKIEGTVLKQININTATLDELRSHPYIKYQLANPIIAYRDQHGAFTKIEDIKKVFVITDDIYYKIAPYLTL